MLQQVVFQIGIPSVLQPCHYLGSSNLTVLQKTKQHRKCNACCHMYQDFNWFDVNIAAKIYLFEANGGCPLSEAASAHQQTVLTDDTTPAPAHTTVGWLAVSMWYVKGVERGQRHEFAKCMGAVGLFCKIHVTGLFLCSGFISMYPNSFYDGDSNMIHIFS